MTPSRLKNVEEKLTYVRKRRQELINTLFDAQIENKSLDHISHFVGDILSNTVECFEYLARDIAESFLQAIINDPRRKIYFPFYERQLEDFPWRNLKSIRSQTFGVLEDLARKAERKERIPRMSMDYSVPVHIHELVIKKKHFDILPIAQSGDKEVVANLGGMKIVVGLKQFGGEDKAQIEMSPGIKYAKARTYVLASTSEEIRDLCLGAEQATRRVLSDIYNQIFNTSIDLIESAERSIKTHEKPPHPPRHLRQPGRK